MPNIIIFSPTSGGAWNTVIWLLCSDYLLSWFGDERNIYSRCCSCVVITVRHQTYCAITTFPPTLLHLMLLVYHDAALGLVHQPQREVPLRLLFTLEVNGSLAAYTHTGTGYILSLSADFFNKERLQYIMEERSRLNIFTDPYLD